MDALKDYAKGVSSFAPRKNALPRSAGRSIDWSLCALLLVVVCLAGCNSEPSIEEVGGYRFVFEPDNERTTDPPATTDDLLPVLKQRLVAAGYRGAVVRIFENDQVEVLIPGADQSTLARIQGIVAAGRLELRVLANAFDHQEVIDRAAEEDQQKKQIVLDQDGNPVAKWVRVGTVAAKNSKPVRFKTAVADAVIRDAKSKEVVRLERVERQIKEQQIVYGPDLVSLKEFLRTGYLQPDGTLGGIEELEVLVIMHDYDPSGAGMTDVEPGFDFAGRPSVNFNPSIEASIRIGKITSNHLPDAKTGREHRLGIILDNELLSAPAIRGTITSHGQITGIFTQQEVDDLCIVLRSGSLPMHLKSQPVAIDKIDPE